ncbi:type II toxin-antitoxin system PemK/MazF family toxin [Acidobacteria bacterium ACD]|nr:MAG: type II toxin-antitoxin system PemK/MazF family toxin [Acidobacteriota bacterium]MCE7956750.1 type II toxin-antitoxin system PemK/MazF family toxin [Acidobacteria bacterium ACB2]MDL1949838.1 type II toxin-antitoxin system PemK/MazF family toxin [Acidobacteria bacterium ACD]
MTRGEVWWVDLPDPVASSPGGTHPVVVVQANAFNRSRLATVLAVVLTSNLRLAEMPGNVLVRGKEAGLPRDSVANVTQVITVDRSFLRSRAGRLERRTLDRLDHGLALVLGLL